MSKPVGLDQAVGTGYSIELPGNGVAETVEIPAKTSLAEPPQGIDLPAETLRMLQGLTRSLTTLVTQGRERIGRAEYGTGGKSTVGVRTQGGQALDASELQEPGGLQRIFAAFVEQHVPGHVVEELSRRASNQLGIARDQGRALVRDFLFVQVSLQGRAA